MKTISGYIIKYNSPSHPMRLPSGKTVTESFSPNAFADSVANINAGKSKIEANIEHTQNNALVRIGVTGKNVTLEHRNDGVHASINLADDTLSNDIFERAKAGIVTGLSIEFKPTVDPIYGVAGGDYTRTVTKGDLKGFGVVANPAYPSAQIESTVESVNRNVSAVELQAIAAEIEQLEFRRLLTPIYQYQAWLFAHGA